MMQATLLIHNKLHLTSEQVCQIIYQELGKSMDALFLNFDNIPLATASVRFQYYNGASDFYIYVQIGSANELDHKPNV